MEFKNRIWIAPMCMYSAEDGVIGEWHRAHIGALATGGTGLIIAEATAVTPAGRISLNCPGIWDDVTANAWRPVVDFAHEMNTKIALQLAHAGRKASKFADGMGGHAYEADGGWQTVSSTDQPYGDFPAPRRLSTEEVFEHIAAFVSAADRAVAVGFDAVELHAAHGYLMHQFLSPLINDRDDQFGGSLENRMRFVVETARQIRENHPSLPLLVRISATDWAEGGWDLDSSVALAIALKAVGVDFIDVSTAGAVPVQNVVATPHFQVPFATAIRERAEIPTGAVGLITESHRANAVIENGEADVVLIARAALRNPRWPWQAAQELGVDIDVPRQIRRGALPK
jgi:2,4-dienoyl-CoA reductase-like NADH-dependent reductase (Old Yellow Enzyme family)